MPCRNGMGPNRGGRGRMNGRGRRWMGADALDANEMMPRWLNATPEEERTFLEEKARHLEAVLAQVNRRLEALKTDSRA